MNRVPFLSFDFEFGQKFESVRCVVQILRCREWLLRSSGRCLARFVRWTRLARYVGGAWVEESGPTFATETHDQGESGMANRISWSLEAESLAMATVLNGGMQATREMVEWDLVLALKATESSESQFLWLSAKQLCRNRWSPVFS